MNVSFIVYFKVALILLFAGALLPLLAGRCNRAANLIGCTCCLSGSTIGMIASIFSLLNGHTESFSFFLPGADLVISFQIDGLAAFFLIPLFFLSVSTGLYGANCFHLPRRGAQSGRHWLFFNTLVASMALVILAADGFSFLLSWEMMSLSSFFLIIHGAHDSHGNRAGWIYLCATHLGTAFLFVLFLEEYELSGTFQFSGLIHLSGLSSHTAAGLFLLALIGFGTKAGLVPMHGWLPEAHGSAPSHVSALMSGLMVKTALYAFLRQITLFPQLPDWCGLLTMFLGIISALFGIIMASRQTDLKRSLGYSTIENVGVIFFAIGGWLTCDRLGQSIPGIILLAGGLLHVWNHSLFKSLLFLSAGNIVHAVGFREMSRMGGVMRTMPLTGGFLLFGSASLAALPPLNGFISEWLLLYGLFQAGLTVSGIHAFLFLLFIILLALIGGLAILTVTRLTGVVLAGAPRDSLRAGAGEVGALLLASMVPGACLCLMIGVFPSFFTNLVQYPLFLLTDFSSTVPSTLSGLFPEQSLWTLILLLPVTTAMGITALRFHTHRPDNKSVWGCGFVRPTPRFAYTAGGYSQLMEQSLLGSAFCLPKKAGAEKPSLFPHRLAWQLSVQDPVMTGFMVPIFTKTAALASRCHKLHTGRLGFYLAYFFITVVALLAWAVLS